MLTTDAELASPIGGPGNERRVAAESYPSPRLSRGEPAASLRTALRASGARRGYKRRPGPLRRFRRAKARPGCPPRRLKQVVPYGELVAGEK